MALWNTGDGQTVDRRNREAIAGRLTVPLYDRDGNNAITLTPLVVQPTLLTVTSGTQLLYTATTLVAHITSIAMTNTSASAVQVYLDLVSSGGAITLAEIIYRDSVPAFQTVEIEVPYFLESGGAIRATVQTASAVSFSANILTYDAHPVGMTLRTNNGVLLTASATTYYTVPTLGVTHAVLLATTLCNSHTVAVTPTVYRVPSGQTAATSRIHHVASLQANETYINDTPKIMMPGDFISASASVTDVCAMRLTVIEVD